MIDWYIYIYTHHILLYIYIYCIWCELLMMTINSHHELTSTWFINMIEITIDNIVQPVNDRASYWCRMQKVKQWLKMVQITISKVWKEKNLQVAYVFFNVQAIYPEKNTPTSCITSKNTTMAYQKHDSENRLWGTMIIMIIMASCSFFYL